MARPLRIDLADGWYHITSRGNNRQNIYLNDQDRKYFLGLLAEMPERFRVEVHAYALMNNHYHLLIRTPNANASRAVQWLNVSYSVWWNRRHERCGHVFQGRFKSILVEGGSWLLELSLYVHFNPVAVDRLGLNKNHKRLENIGYKVPSSGIRAQRLRVLNTYAWSSYRFYGGYQASPGWLTTTELMKRAGKGDGAYRRLAEKRLGSAEGDSIWSNLKRGYVLGEEEFAHSVCEDISTGRETQGKKAVRAQAGWGQIVKAVEEIKEESWKNFSGRRGDWGKGMVFYLAQKHTGMTLREIGEQADGMDYAAVSIAIKRFSRSLEKDGSLVPFLQKAGSHLNIQHSVNGWNVEC
jgi:REP element-mobilizing transposase RayT